MSDEPQGGTTRVFVSQHSHPGVQIRFELESTGDHPAFIREDAQMRFLCHMLIERLPTEAIPKVLENVYDHWEWHSRPRLQAAPQHLLVGPGVPVGAPVDPPPFRIEIEE